MIAQQYPHVTAIRSDTNLGFAGGNNLGITAARGKYLFFINNDTVLRGDDLTKEQGLRGLILRLESTPSIAVVCPKIRFTWGESPIQFTGFTPLSTITLRNRSIGYGEADTGQYDEAHATPYAHGAAMLVKREALERVGLMPDCYFLYYEELDWSMMFRRAGYDIWYDPCFTVFHKESQSTGQGSPLRTYYITRNRLLFARRNISAPKRYLTYTYLTMVVCLRDVLKNVMKGRRDLAKSAVAALLAFMKGEQGYHLLSKKE